MSSEATKFAKRKQKLQDEVAPDAVITTGDDNRSRLNKDNVNQQETTAEQFPTADLAARSKLDEEMSTRAALSKGTPGKTPYGRLPDLKQQELQWLREKAAAAEEANFQAWFAQNYDKLAPAEKKRARELFPSFYKQRDRLLKSQADQLVRYAQLKLHGVQSYEDLILKYLVESGQVNLEPLEQLLNPEEGARQATQRQRFQRGIANPFRVFGNPGVADGAVDLADTRETNRAAFGPDGSKTWTGTGYLKGYPPFGQETLRKRPQSQAGAAEWYNVLSQN